MYGFVLMLLVLDALLLCLVVLLQSGKGGGLAAEFGGASSSTDTFLGGRQAATLLTKASWVTGGLFIALALLLAILSARTRAPASVLEGQFAPPVQEAPTPLLEREQQAPPEGLEMGEQPSRTEGGEEGQTPPGGGE
ncbi:MAG: preprotein translocase subunit SecG [Gemmatimonadota bacterium]|nr:MAG: preprotein translocase subunit SecG [Gemmatimonadota bacterium]